MLPHTTLGRTRRPRSDTYALSGVLVVAMYAWILTTAGDAFELPAAQWCGASSCQVLRPASTTGRLQTQPRASVLPVPPTRPPTSCEDEGDDGEGGIWLQTIDASKLRATCQLWLLQSEWRSSPDPVFVDVQEALTSLSRWDEPPSSRPMGVYVGGELEGLIAARYEPDRSTLWNALLGKQAILVDHIVVSPSAPKHAALLIYAGVMHSLQQLAYCHGMRLTLSAGDAHA